MRVPYAVSLITVFRAAIIRRAVFSVITAVITNRPWSPARPNSAILARPRFTNDGHLYKTPAARGRLPNGVVVGGGSWHDRTPLARGGYGGGQLQGASCPTAVLNQRPRTIRTVGFYCLGIIGSSTFITYSIDSVPSLDMSAYVVRLEPAKRRRIYWSLLFFPRDRIGNIKRKIVRDARRHRNVENEKPLKLFGVSAAVVLVVRTNYTTIRFARGRNLKRKEENDVDEKAFFNVRRRYGRNA